MLKDRLREAISKVDMSITTLARLAEVPRQNIMKWLQGSSPNIEQLSRVANVLEESLDWLVSGKMPEDPMGQFMEKLHIHTGLYEITVKKVVKKRKGGRS